MSKVIFLDIDGVLCTYKSHWANCDGMMMRDWDSESCKILKKICISNQVKLVISSTWRFEQHQEDFNTQYTKHFPGSLLHDDWRTKSLFKTRGHEIEEWLSRHPEVTKYRIIDDDTDFLESQKQYHTWTTMEDGITYQQLRILNDSFKDV